MARSHNKLPARIEKPSIAELAKQDPYERLGLSRDASDDELKAARRRLVKELHPDPQGHNGDEERLKLINAAYDEVKREVTWGRSDESFLRNWSRADFEAAFGRLGFDDLVRTLQRVAMEQHMARLHEI